MKFLGKCPCGCDRDMYEVEIYKDFRILKKPFYSKDWQIVAEKQTVDPLTEILLKAEFSDCQTLADDTGHSYKPTIEHIITKIKLNIDKFYKRRKKIQHYVFSEAVACGLISSDVLKKLEEQS